MRQATVTFNVYKFDELSSKAKERAINDHVTFLMETMQTGTWKNFDRAIEKADRMLSPWFTGSYILEYCKDEILAELKEYEYLETGEGYNA